jgi:ribosomal protein L11 methyltransferase
VIEENARFDIVVANILANPLQVLAPALIKRIKPNGKLVLSGILDRQANDVIETYRPWVTLSVWKEQDSWVCLHGTLNQSAAISTPNQRPRTIFLGAFLVCFFGLMIVTSLWQAPILHALSPRMDELPNPVQQIAFSGINQLQTRICKIMPCRQNRIEDFTAWRLVLVNLGMESQNQAVAQNKTEFESILEVQIQNRLLVPIAWPNLELSLTDTDDKLIAQIQLKPQEWVPKAWQASHPAFLLEGAPDQALIDAAIPLQLPNHAAGYRLRISYPPKI